ncbi:Putative hybrid glycoside hydrolase, group 92(-20) family protein precursor [Flavobacterium indicum GPTSA100-9 = DSM 17447]|uniref:Putative hybrid glycoside hydrolase, group 92(-20) family protein n=1 Tax=Flavobacterium indicum (strain DSM 17447 / CIP 109464 / GPTSA100-9) TaxID=1094466 RepID=H8XU46_FLAIG|nr:GH92 family glycosyl hydrolase [Flavobacterium indicum]CCG52829.1 Putative hybrid glycoside hydrolase, group 92(-20) family protein precursor [Flavobacterium indicum GPTSA100-9 = DSM 17447]
MKKTIFFLLFAFAVSAQQTQFSKYVNPFIGTGGHGHTFPGATVPYGMVQLSPDTRIDGSWDGCSGYHYDDSIIYGFSHTHLNGTGCSDYGDIMLMPTMGKPSFNPKEYSSNFKHGNEKASAGFYSVKLDKHNIDVRLTSSTRVGFHEYTFNEAGQANIILDLNHRDKLLEGRIRIIDNKTIEVLRRSEAWAKDQYVYARIEFNMPFKKSSLISTKKEGLIDITENNAAVFSKKVKKGEKILVKVSLSPTSYEGAKLNSSEINHWNFEQTKKEAEALWNKELAKIEVSSENKDQLAIFYTALYHTMMQPNIAQDVDGKYRGRDNKIHVAEGFNYYSVFSLWDTFRAAHPLYTLIDKKRTADYINTFIKQYEQGGRLPVWELASNETDCMIGYHSVSVIADAMAKGIKGFDYEKAFEAAKHSAMLDHLGLEAYKRQGFISMDDEHESVSKTVEYAYDDWCIAQMAQILNKKEDYEYFIKRSQSWKNIFDWETGFMRPKKNGGWDKPFDPREVNNNFTEGNSWHYSFFVPQDIPGMIEAYGGKEKFEAKLDEMFSAESKTTGREQVDVTGLIGQYAHGNEPSHHMAYLYNYIGKPEKTNKMVHYILTEFYKNTPDGLIGNEDCGQMSAWYVLSAMGIYDVTPGEMGWDYVLPIFKEVKLNLEDKKVRVLNEKTNKSTYQWLDTYLEEHSYKYPDFDVAKAVKEEDLIKDIIPVPTIQAASRAFKNELQIEIKSQNPKDVIYYEVKNLNQKDGDQIYLAYSKPFIIKESSIVLAYVLNNGQKSYTISATFFKKPNNYTIDIKSTYNPQYHAGGPEGLLDGIHGTENWRKGDWQGYQTQDFEAIIDLQKAMPITSIKASFLQDQRSWILLPKQVEYYISNDNKTFELVEIITHNIDPKLDQNIVHSFDSNKKFAEARYVKVIARNFGKLPEWHIGHPYNGEAFIFIDEIIVK